MHETVLGVVSANESEGKRSLPISCRDEIESIFSKFTVLLEQLVTIELIFSRAHLSLLMVRARISAIPINRKEAVNNLKTFLRTQESKRQHLHLSPAAVVMMTCLHETARRRERGREREKTIKENIRCFRGDITATVLSVYRANITKESECISQLMATVKRCTLLYIEMMSWTCSWREAMTPTQQREAVAETVPAVTGQVSMVFDTKW